MPNQVVLSDEYQKLRAACAAAGITYT